METHCDTEESRREEVQLLRRSARPAPRPGMRATQPWPLPWRSTGGLAVATGTKTYVLG